MKYWIEYHIDLETPIFRVCYDFKYHTGSYPVISFEQAARFMVHEFGSGELPYSLDCLRTEVLELVHDACQKMVKAGKWKENAMSITEFSKACKAITPR